MKRILLLFGVLFFIPTCYIPSAQDSSQEMAACKTLCAPAAVVEFRASGGYSGVSCKCGTVAKKD